MQKHTDGQATISIDYRIIDRSDTTNSVKQAAKTLIAIKKRFLKDFKLSDIDLKAEVNYVFGNHDLNLVLSGNISAILKFLLNPAYGLINFQSGFYNKYVIESRTTWKFPVHSLP
jgi:hypothetical protein